MRFVETYNLIRSLILSVAAICTHDQWRLGSWRAFWYQVDILRDVTIGAFWFLLLMMMFLLGALPKGDSPVQLQINTYLCVLL